MAMSCVQGIASSKVRQLRFFSLLVLLCCCLVVPIVAAGESSNSELIESTGAMLKTLAKSFENDFQSKDRSDRFSDYIATLSVLRGGMQKCVDTSSLEIEKYKAGTDKLDSGGASQYLRAEQSLKDTELRKSTLNNERVTCAALLLEIDSLSDSIKKRRQDLLADYLLAKDPDIFQIIASNYSRMDDWINAVQSFLKNRVQLQSLSIKHWIWLLTMLVLGALAGMLVRNKLNSIAASLTGKELTGRLALSLCINMARTLPYVFAACGVLSALIAVQETEISTSAALLVALISYLLLTAISRAILKPRVPAEMFIKLSISNGRQIYRHLQVLILLGILVLLAYVVELRFAMSDEQWQITRSVILLLGILNLVWLSLFFNRIPGIFGSALFRVIIISVLLTSAVAEIIGYRNLSLYLVQGLLGSALLTIALWLVSALLTDTFDGLDQGRYDWQLYIRKKLRLNKKQPVPGLLWLRLITILAIWLVFIISVVRLWGYNAVSWAALVQIITDGFDFGDYRIVPARLILAVIIFSILIAFMRWFRQETLPSWVNRTALDHGAREALVSIISYIGIIIAAVFGLSLAGFSFTNIAIVAGALSVGIGFGLQNIVNNFISGIILLFERPIRTGDWVVVGNTEGYVRKISIRSTQIETFDRADVIVPNSELISNQVTNWMLHDPWGRVIVPVGVAYGSDVGKVREVLLRVANEHEMVLKDESKVSPPKVLFRGFGDSSLNFELRCYLRNVDRRLDTTSDLNFAIDKAFREANIEIPFPQRDLHLRSVDNGIQLTGDPDKQY